MSNVIPTRCPNCNTDLREYGVDLQCINVNCSAATVKQVESFIKELGIENVSESRLKEWGIYTFVELLRWTPMSHSKSQVTFNNELQTKMYSVSKEKLMRSFSCEGVGTTNFDKLLVHFSTLEDVNSIIRGETISTTLPVGIGIKTLIKCQKDWEFNYDILLDITTHPRYNYLPKEIIKEEVVMSSNKLEGKTFLATGKFNGYSQSELEKTIIDNGGIVNGAVNNMLCYLICADNSRGVSSKWVKADKLGINIISEDEFNKMIGE
jgi:DNA ligase (NAD+)